MSTADAATWLMVVVILVVGAYYRGYHDGLREAERRRKFEEGGILKDYEG